jgi:predicted outer membrane repeat protein
MLEAFPQREVAMLRSASVVAPVLAAITLVLVLATLSSARTWHILPDGSGDAPTIQAGIDSAATGDTVELAAGEFSGDGNRDLYFRGKSITVTCENADPTTCIIDCGGTVGDLHFGFAFIADEDRNSQVHSVTITGGYHMAGAAVCCDNTSPSITDCILSGNTATVAGGAVASDGSPLFSRCTFEGNAAPYGGAVYSNYGAPEIQDCVFRDNVAEHDGGGVLSEHGTTVVTQSEFADNSAGDNGGAILGFYDTISLFEVVATGNDAGGGGGAFFLEDVYSESEVHGCIVVGNSAQAGAGVYIAAHMTVTECLLWDNFAAMYGGGLLLTGNNHVSGCTLVRNGAADFGGSLLQIGEGTLLLEKTIVVFGTASGGVFCTSSASISASCCDVYGNAGGDWVGSMGNQTGINGNISVDPMFCDAVSADFRLQRGSPCLPAYSGGCGQIGALGAGDCGTALISSSWGAVKARYRYR